MKLYKIKKSDIDKNGKGLYASKNIEAGTKIIDYIGKIVTKKQIDESDKYDNSKPIYLFTLNKRYTLDGDFSWNIAGLINHSCENNCEYEGKGLKIWVTAIKDIKPRYPTTTGAPSVPISGFLSKKPVSAFMSNVKRLITSLKIIAHTS